MSEERQYVSNFVFPSGETYYVKDTKAREDIEELKEHGAGQPGKSAYEIAVEEGFIGTEEEWLASLQGATGGIDAEFNNNTGVLTIIPGVSPTVQTEPITGGHRVTITDAEHPQGQSFDVLNGDPGDDYVLTLQDKAEIAGMVDVALPYVTPQQFGAKGDGETDDTAAIQAAVDTGGSVIFGRDKTYRITAPIVFDAAGQRRGCTYDGGGCTILHTASAAFCLSSGVNGGLKQCELKGFRFESEGRAYDGVYVESVNGSNYMQETVISRCAFSGQRQGIYAGGYRVRLQDCRFESCEYGVLQDCANSCVVSNCCFNGCSYGMKMNIPYFNLVENCKFHGCTNGLFITGIDESGGQVGCTVIGCSFTSGQNAANRHIRCYRAADVLFIGNNIDGAATQYVEFTDCLRVRFVDTNMPNGNFVYYMGAGYGSGCRVTGGSYSSIGVGAVDSDVFLDAVTATIITTNTTLYPRADAYIHADDCKLITKPDGTDGRLGAGVRARLKSAGIDTPTGRIDLPTELPSVTASDNGKVLGVVNGAWAAQTVPSAEGASF